MVHQLQATKVTEIEIKRRWNSDWEWLPMHADDLIIVIDYPPIIEQVELIPGKIGEYETILHKISDKPAIYLETKQTSILVYDVRLPQFPEFGSARESNA